MCSRNGLVENPDINIPIKEYISIMTIQGDREEYGISMTRDPGDSYTQQSLAHGFSEDGRNALPMSRGLTGKTSQVKTRLHNGRLAPPNREGSFTEARQMPAL